MTSISNDREFRDTIDQLDRDRQRALASLFVHGVADLVTIPELKEAIETAMDPDASLVRRRDAYRSAKAVSVSTYTACGRDADWLAQAEHFVAAACTVALTPDDVLPERTSVAWRAAMHARTARNCAMIETGAAEEVTEAQRQYETLGEFAG